MINQSSSARPVSARPATDDRSPSYGVGRVVMALFWVAGAYFVYTSAQDFFNHSNEPFGLRITSVLAAFGYLVAALGITHNGRRMRMVAWAALGFEFVGVLVTGLTGVGIEEIGSFRTVWGNLGADHYYIPLILPIIGIAWMWYADPRRIVEISENFDRKAWAKKHPRSK